MTKHVVLGGSGVVGRETVAALAGKGVQVASVSRTGIESATGESIRADLLEKGDAIRALQGAEVAYLVLGLPYSLAVWRRDWPVVVGNVIEACRANGTRLVFLDNVYAYGRVSAAMTEETPIRPSSKKGQVRTDLLTLLASARDDGLEVTIARSADFYGPGASTSVFNSMVIDAVVAGRAPTWMLNAKLPHSMTYTPDIGATLATLGTDPRARGQVWHVPTAPALTGDEYVSLAAGEGTKRKVMSKAVMQMGALFIPIAREALDLAYQNTEPYFFDSSAFESVFGVQPTGYREGIARTLEFARQAK